MDFRARLRRMLAENDLTEWQLAERLGMHRGAIVRILADERRPEPLECLLLAGFRAELPEREDWLKLSGLTAAQRYLVSKGVGDPEMDLTGLPPEIGKDVATFLDFMVNAHPERRKAVQSILRDWREER